MKSDDGLFIFYADESGDHSLTSVDPTYPVFSLSLCGFRKETYCSRVVPNFQRFKFKYFGHDAVVLHEHEIRKQKNAFRILNDETTRLHFLDDLSECVRASPFTIFASVILKSELKHDLFPENPYSISLRVCLQQAHAFLKARGEIGKRTHFIFEMRGKKEDAELELEFRRLVAGQNALETPMYGFEIHFSDKRSNSTGMQIADLTARPLGLRRFRKDQPNRAFDLIEKKIYRKRSSLSPNRGVYTP